MHLEFDNRLGQIDEERYLTKAYYALDTLVEKKGPGKEFTGWVDLPLSYDQEEFRRIQLAAKRIRENSDVLICIGIGGSYLGARAVLEALQPIYDKKKPEILYAGNHLSARALAELMDYVEDKDISVNVISKSGTTTEPAVAFRLVRELMEKKYGKEDAAKRIFATTDKSKGALKELADAEGYETFIIPDEVGGRYSVLTPVGLLPIAAGGVDIEKLMEGAAAAMLYKQKDPENPAIRYAISRYDLYHRQGKFIELLVQYEPYMAMVSEWWKQLFGESEGKQGKGIYPASAQFTTDLHSLGQMIQEGERNLFETVVFIRHMQPDIGLQEQPEDLDGLNYLAGKTCIRLMKRHFKG